jgi:chromosome segregation ATPase
MATPPVRGYLVPLEGLQDYIRDQLQQLRSEVLKYDQAVAEYYKAEHANELLARQVNAQKDHCAQLEELIDLKETTHDHDSDPSGIEQELTNLRYQVRNTEEALLAKTTEFDHANERLQEQGTEVAKYKVTFMIHY